MYPLSSNNSRINTFRERFAELKARYKEGVVTTAWTSETAIIDIPKAASLQLVPPLQSPDFKKAQKLRDLAAGMEAQINAKFDSGVSRQRVTARRARIAASMRDDGRRLQQVQSWLRAIADCLEKGNLPPILSEVSSKAQLEIFCSFTHDKWNQRDSFIANRLSNLDDDWSKKLRRMQLDTVEKVNEAIAAIESLDSLQREDPATVKIKQLEYELIGRDIPGYFPTPRSICEKMVDLASIGNGMSVLEPSAGKGSIAEVVREKYPNVSLNVCELQHGLREILKLKGFTVLSNNDFTNVTGQYDRILMNPPFEKGQDIEHIRHAYSLLAEGGRLVAIAASSYTFRQDLKYQAFRDWLTVVGAQDEALPDEAFLKSDRPTGVNTRLIVIDK